MQAGPFGAFSSTWYTGSIQALIGASLVATPADIYGDIFSAFRLYVAGWPLIGFGVSNVLLSLVYGQYVRVGRNQTDQVGKFTPASDCEEIRQELIEVRGLSHGLMRSGHEGSDRPAHPAAAPHRDDEGVRRCARRDLFVGTPARSPHVCRLLREEMSRLVHSPSSADLDARSPSCISERWMAKTSWQADTSL